MSNIRNRIIDGTRRAFEALEDVGYAVLENEESESRISEDDVAYIGGHVSSSVAVISRQLDVVRKILGRGLPAAKQGYEPNSGPFNAVPVTTAPTQYDETDRLK